MYYDGAVQIENPGFCKGRQVFLSFYSLGSPFCFFLYGKGDETK